MERGGGWREGEMERGGDGELGGDRGTHDIGPRGDLINKGGGSGGSH